MISSKFHHVVTEPLRVGNLDSDERAVLNNVKQQMQYLLHPYPDVQIYTKGSSSPQTGYGTFGAVMRFADRTIEQTGRAGGATHNEMELVAVLDALWMLGRPHEVEVYSSSEWLVKCARGEYDRGCYLDHWAKLDYLVKQHIVDWHWIRGSPELARAHELARQAQPDRRSA